MSEKRFIKEALLFNQTVSWDGIEYYLDAYGRVVSTDCSNTAFSSVYDFLDNVDPSEVEVVDV